MNTPYEIPNVVTTISDTGLLLRAIDRQVEIDRRSANAYGRHTETGKEYLQRAKRLLAMKEDVARLFNQQEAS